MIFIGYLLWRRRRQSNLRKRWMEGMRQQRPDSLSAYGLTQDRPPSTNGGGSSRGHRHSGSRAGIMPPPGLGFLDSDDDLPWGESRRIPGQRAEMRERAQPPAAQTVGPASVATTNYHNCGASVDEASKNPFNASSPVGAPPSSYQQSGNSGSASRNPFTGGILGLNRSGSGSDSSTRSNGWMQQARGSKTLSINKNSISLPVPVPVPSPVRKPAIYKDEDPFSDRLGLSPITERTSIAPSAASGSFTHQNPAVPPLPPSLPHSAPTNPAPQSNWAQRSQLAYAHSPAPSTPSMYPPTLPADDELDDTEGFDSDGTLEKRPPLPSTNAATGPQNAMDPRTRYSDVDGYSAFQNLFVVPNRPKPPPPPASRVPPLSINTAVENAPGNRGSTSTSAAPPRPPRSILRTSNGSLALGPAKVRVQSSAEFIPLTPPASTPGHSPNLSYSSPTAGLAHSSSAPSLGLQQQLASPPVSPIVQERKVQEILANRRLLLDRRLDGGVQNLAAREREQGSGSD